MGICSNQEVVCAGADLPLADRRLVPNGHDGSALLDNDGLPINTSMGTLQTIDEVIISFSNVRSMCLRFVILRYRSNDLTRGHRTSTMQWWNRMITVVATMA